MQAGDSSIEMQAMGGESRHSADLAALSPSASSAAAAPGASTSVAGLSIMEQAKRERAEAEHVAQIRARQAARKNRRASMKPRTGLWSGNGPKTDKLCGATEKYNCYARPFAYTRQIWSDTHREPGVVGSVCYSSTAALDAVICGGGDVVSTGLRLCHLPEAVASLMGRATMVSLFPLTIGVGTVAMVTVGPAAGLVVAYANRRADAQLRETGQSRRVHKTKKAPKPKRDPNATVHTVTGTDVNQDQDVDSDVSAGAESFSMPPPPAENPGMQN